MKKIVFYTTPNGEQPCEKWLDSLHPVLRRKVLSYITRVALGGSKKSVRSVGEGVLEIKVHDGPGLRVYFTEIGNQTLLLLTGGNKSTQFRDIQQAKQYWRNYAQKKSHI